METNRYFKGIKLPSYEAMFKLTSNENNEDYESS